MTSCDKLDAVSEKMKSQMIQQSIMTAVQLMVSMLQYQQCAVCDCAMHDHEGS